MTSIAHVAYRWVVKTITTFVVVLSVIVGVLWTGQPDYCKDFSAKAAKASLDRRLADEATAAAAKKCLVADWWDYVIDWGEAGPCVAASIGAWRLDSTAIDSESEQSDLKETLGDTCLGLGEIVRTNFSVATWIVVGLFAMPILIKSVFYFWLAPRAERLPPIRITSGASVPSGPRPQPSAVSISVELGAGDELLLHPDFVQSSDRSARKQTQWLLNPRLPLSSLASGMVSLTRIRAPARGTAQVVVSSQKDSLSEVAVVEIPAGAGMVIQPRSLAGVVKRIDSPVKITAEWRLRSLNAWLTLQFRYLVFHGPCKLIVKGCRGVRAEQPEPSKPRLINQAATLGFSANLDYSIARCETFVSYLRGQEDLFNDLFSGGPGWFIYEEVPDSREKAGVTGKGLEGVVDAFLKAFGI